METISFSNWGPSASASFRDPPLLYLSESLCFRTLWEISVSVPFGEPLLPNLLGSLCFCTFWGASASVPFGGSLLLHLVGSLCFRTFWRVSACVPFMEPQLLVLSGSLSFRTFWEISAFQKDRASSSRSPTPCQESQGTEEGDGEIRKRKGRQSKRKRSSDSVLEKQA